MNEQPVIDFGAARILSLADETMNGSFHSIVLFSPATMIAYDRYTEYHQSIPIWVLLVPAQGTIRTLSEVSVAGFDAVRVNWFCPKRSDFFNSAEPQDTTQEVGLRSIWNPVKAV